MSERAVPKEEGELVKTTLRIPVGDWVEKYTQEEPDLSSPEKAFELMRSKGYAPATMGVLCIIGGLRDEAPLGVALFPKSTLLAGASHAISSRISAVRDTYELPSGKVITARSIVANVVFPTLPDDDGDSDGEMGLDVEDFTSPGPFNYVETGTEEARNRAERYLLERVPGYIYSRLKILAVSGGDVAATWELLKQKGDDLVSKLE